jgi:hypothetical protein
VGIGLGYSRAEAARFSLLLSIPTILAASALIGYELHASGDLALRGTRSILRNGQWFPRRAGPCRSRSARRSRPRGATGRQRSGFATPRAS